MKLITPVILLLTIAFTATAKAESQNQTSAKTSSDTPLMTYPAPKSKGNILTDAIGGKSDCHAMTSSKTFQGKKVVYWFCWGKNGQKIPAVAAMWSEVKPDLFASANVTPPPQSVGNTLTRRDGAKSDCHLADHLVNKEKVTVSQWVCWSND